MTAGADAQTPAQPRTRPTAPGHSRPGSLVSPFLRHSLILIGSAVVSYVLAVYLPVEGQAEVWIGAAVGLGLVSGLLAGNWLGAFFLLVGAVTGVLVEMHLRLGASPATAQELAAAGPLLLVALGASLLAFAASVIVVRLIRRR